MGDWRRQRTTSYGPRSKGNTGKYDSETPPPADHVSFNQEQVGRQYGWLRIVSPERRYLKGWRDCRVLTECTGCGRRSWTILASMTRGKTKGCQSCSQRRAVPRWMDRRFTAAKQRCENPKDAGYKNYGARGIRFDFPSVTDACLYMIGTFGIPDREMEIDRIDTNGGYAPGNLRFVGRKTNCANRRNTILSRYDPESWPYAKTTVIRKLSQGMSRDEIIRDAEKAVREKRKNWRGIQARLASMTYEMPADVTVLPYRAF